MNCLQRMFQEPKLFQFDTNEEYAGWLLRQPATPVRRGDIYIISIKEIKTVWLKIGDGINALIDLPHIISPLS